MLHQALEGLKGKVAIRSTYDNYIGGQWVAPVQGRYFDNPSPVTGQTVCQVARGTKEDIDLALDAAHKAKDAWGRTSYAERAVILNKIADRIEAEPAAARARSRPSTTASRSARRPPPTFRSPSTTSAISPAASARRKARIAEIDHDTVAYHFHEPLGVVGQIIPWNFPILMAVLEARARTRRRQLRRAEARRTDARCDHGADGPYRRPPARRRAQRRQRLRRRGRQAARAEQAHRQDRLHRRDHDRPPDHAIRVRKSDPGARSNSAASRPTSSSPMSATRTTHYFDKALEGFAMFALNQGEVCTCPSRALVHESIYDRFMERAIARVDAIRPGSPLDPSTMIGAQASNDQLEKILSYIDIGRDEGAKVLTGGERAAAWRRSGRRLLRQADDPRATTRCASSRKRSSAPWCR